LDLSSEFSDPTVDIDSLITQLDGSNNPIYPPATTACTNSVSLTEEPIFIENANLCGDGNCDTCEDNANCPGDCNCASVACGTECSIVSEADHQLKPYIFGNYMAWQDRRDGTYQIWLMDLTTETETQLTGVGAVPAGAPSGGEGFEPVVYENSVTGNVYVAYVYVEFPGPQEDLYLYDMSSNNTIKITTSGNVAVNVGTSGNHNIAIYNNRLVWRDNTDGNLYLYDIEDTNTIQLTTTGTANQPNLYADILIAESLGDIYIRDLSLWPINNTSLLYSPGLANLFITGFDQNNLYFGDTFSVHYCDITNCNGTAQLLDNVFEERYPDAFGEYSVWQTREFGNFDIKQYQIGGAINQYTTDTDSQMNPAIYGDKVVFQSEYWLMPSLGYDILYKQICSGGCADFDLDGDGWGYGCVGQDFDCDETNASINPAGTESCNGKDDDCDGLIDEGMGPIYNHYIDFDLDLHGDINDTNPISDCRAVISGYSTLNDDCDDDDDEIYPGHTELCDGKDNDCNVGTDDGSGYSCQVRYIRINYGEYSHDSSGGSRVLEIDAFDTSNVDWANYTLGATAVTSTKIPDPPYLYVDERDLINGMFTDSPETGNFIFDYNDANQWADVDLSTIRDISIITTQQIPAPMDREVWEHLIIETSIDNINWDLWYANYNVDAIPGFVEQCCPF